MKRVLQLLLCALLSLFLLAGCAPSSPTPPGGDEKPGGTETYEPIPSYKYTIEYLGDDVFPIGAWMAPPYQNDITPIPDNYITDQAYKDIADSGINLIYALYDLCENTGDITTERNQNVLKALQYADKYGVAYFARDWNEMALMEESDTQDMRVLYDEFDKVPSFSGILVQDEPGLIHFDNLAQMKTNFDKYFEGKTFYTNMMPTYATENQLNNGAASGGGNPSTIELYEKYVDEFLDKVKPQMFSYDFYPMVNSYPNIQSGYFRNMSIVAEKTAEAGIPFWTFIQSCSWGSTVRICNQAEIDWQVNTALAYGAKGIQYFTYWTPYDDSGTNPGFYPSRSDEQIGAMVSHDGKKQDMYYRVQKTNINLTEVGKVLLDCGFAGIVQHGESPDEIPAQDLLTDFRQLKSVSGADAIVGCFDRNGKTVLYVVNNSILSERDNAEISLSFESSLSYEVTQNGQKTTGEGETLTLTLNAGEGALVCL